MSSVRGRRSAKLWADLGLGLLAGAIIPALIILVLDVGLLVVGMWDVFNDASRLGSQGGQSAWVALAETLAVNLPNLVGHIWGIRWVLLLSGCLGALATLGQRASWRIHQVWGQGLSFLVILAVLSLALTVYSLVAREERARLVAFDRTTSLLRYFGGESYASDLVMGIVFALVVALIFWEFWRGLYARLRGWVGLSQTQHPSTSPRTRVSGTQDDEKAAQLTTLTQDVSTGTGTARLTESSLRGVIWVGGLFLLCIVAWLPLDSAYRRHVPRTISENIYLFPGTPEREVRIRVGASPHKIVFANSVGHGLFDAKLLTSPDAPSPLFEVRDFRLEETPEGSFSYAHMNIEGMKPGDYYLHMSLRPAGELAPDAFRVMGDGEGVVSYSLYQGGGTAYRLVTAGMAAVLTADVLGIVILVIEGVAYIRDR